MQTFPDPSVLAALWTRARAMFERARAAIGEPQAIAARAALTREAGRDIAGWLARLESIVRKLLLAIAAGLVQDERRSPALRPPLLWRAPQTAAAANRKQNKTAPEGARRPDFDRAHPETWPARFALAPPRDPQAVPESRAPRIRALWGPTPPAPVAPKPPAPKRVTEPALRFALRLEALRRVLADPLPHAHKLARLFRRLSRRYPEAAPRFAIAPARPSASDPCDPRLIIDAIAAAISAAPALADTS